jgi:hypothetical protein
MARYQRIPLSNTMETGDETQIGVASEASSTNRFLTQPSRENYLQATNMTSHGRGQQFPSFAGLAISIYTAVTIGKPLHIPNIIP